MNYDLLGGQSLSHALTAFEIRGVVSDTRSSRCLSFADRLKRYISLRRSRGAIFGSDLFADPVWDMLLDLCLASELRRQVSVSSLCIASASPSTTGLRWLKVMSDQGLIIRQDDPDDRRRIFVSLAEDTEQKLRVLLHDWLGMPMPAQLQLSSKLGESLQGSHDATGH